MALEVVGRHALMFDDDAMADFVNSAAALVEWNSLSIDRYDVRHLLLEPLPSRSSRHRHLDPQDSSIESELDRERYLDLHLAWDIPDSDERVEDEKSFEYHMVSLSYSNTAEGSKEQSSNAKPTFSPPFFVPSNIDLDIHQIIARTAAFVSNNGGQSEIILRVKQGDNPTFGFLLPNHHLHQYFRFLVDHPDLMNKNTIKVGDGKNEKVEFCEKGSSLWLLGSAYADEEEENDVVDSSPNDNRTVKHLTNKDFSRFANYFTRHKTPQVSNSSTSSEDKIDNLRSNHSELLEPSQDMKKAIDKMVEFILRNGREFEAVLIQQDAKHGRFPFLIPSNPFHPYYLRALQNPQQFRSNSPEIVDKKALMHESNGRKDTLKMATEKQPNRSEVTIDVATAAAILHVATRGAKASNLSDSEISSENKKEAALKNEQWLKAERLKRAKIFTAMIKNGASPLNQTKDSSDNETKEDNCRNKHYDVEHARRKHKSKRKVIETGEEDDSKERDQKKRDVSDTDACRGGTSESGDRSSNVEVSDELRAKVRAILMATL